MNFCVFNIPGARLCPWHFCEEFLEDFLFRGAGSADAHLSHNLLLRRDAQGLEGR